MITNLLSAIPFVGSCLVEWIWGNFSVSNSTLTRFFALHFTLPYLATGVTLLHIFCLHLTGSNNPLGLNSGPEKVPFHWYYSIKDLSGFCLLSGCLGYLAIFDPQLLNDAANFIPANPFVTPIHIVPEWYFLFAYTILRSIPVKVGGVLALVSSILILLVLPGLHTQIIKGLSYYGPIKGYFWSHVVVFSLLTAGGHWPIEAPFLLLTRQLTACYFLFYFALGLLRSI